MKRIGWFVISLLLIALIISLVGAGERMRPSEIRWLFSGELLVEIDEFNDIPIGRGGFSTGFAFAPGRAELAYCAVEEEGDKAVSVLRVVQVEKLWAVDRKSTRIYNTESLEKEPRFEITELYAPFSERERELTRVEAAGTEGSVWGPFLEGPITWSPDGTKLAVYVITEDAAKSYASRDLWVVDYRTGKREILTLNLWVTLAAWSNDSKQLAFVAEPANPELANLSTKPARPGLWLYDVQSDKSKRIADGAISLEWSQDSSQLRFRRSGDAKEAQQYDIASAEMSPTPSLPAEARPWEISPDGRYVAVMKKSMEESRLQVTERATGTLLVDLPAEEMGCWDPGSRMLAYFAGDSALMITAVKGPHRGHAVKVTTEAEYNVPPFQAPLQWSSQATFPQYREARKSGITISTPEPMMSWFALISKGQLCVLCMDHLVPSTHEMAALGRLEPEREREIVTNNMKRIALGIIMYSGDYDQQAPPSSSQLPASIQPYVGLSGVFDRPGYPNQSVYRSLLPDGADLKDLQRPAEIPMGVIDYWPEGGVVAFADGHVEWYPREELKKVLRKGKELLRQSLESTPN